MQPISIPPYKSNRTGGNLLLVMLEYLWIIALIMDGNSVYHADVDRNFYLMHICVVLTYALLLGYLTLRNMKLIKQRIAFSIMLCVYAIVYLFFRFDQMPAMSYALQFVMGLPALYLMFSMLHRRKKLIYFLYRLENVILLFCIMSLFFWFFGTWMGILKPNTSIRINWGGIHTYQGYWGLHFNIQKDGTFGTTFYRNSGIFTEAPMLNLWTDIALAVELFLRPRVSKLKIAIYCATIGTATSTTGLLFIIVCIGLKMLLAYSNGKASKKLAVIGVALLAIPLAIIVVSVVIQKKMTTISYITRMSDYFDALDLWVKYPIMGGGYGEIIAIQPYLKGNTVGFSNTIVGVLALGGLWNAILFYIPHILCMLPKFTKDKNISCFAVCLFFLFVTVVYFGRYLAVTLIAIEMAFLVEAKGRTSLNNV